MSALLQTAMQRLTSVSRLAGRQLVAQAPASRRVFTTKAVKASVGKRDLIEDVAKRTGLPAKEADKVVNAILDSIVDSVAAGEKVVIPGFGQFEGRARAARQGRNPQTGEALQIAASVSPAFSAGKGFKDKVKAAAK